MYNAEVLVLLKPPIAKYILYMTICDACFNKSSDVKSLNHFCDQIKSISAQVIQLVINDSSRPTEAAELISETSEGLSRDGRGLDDLDLIYFMVNHTSLEKDVFDRNGQYEGGPAQVFKSEQYKTLYKYYVNLVSQLSR